MAEQLTYNLTDHTYRTTLGEDEVIIGGKNPLVFEPHIEFTKWAKECSLTLKLSPDLISNTTPTLDKELTIGDSKTGFYFAPQDDVFKFGLILNEKPDDKYLVTIDGKEYYQWTFQLEGWEEFDFFKIPELDNIGERIPEEIAGSYNVFHKDKRHNQYKTGFFGIIYKAKFIDANNKFVYGITEIKNGIFTETCPLEFLSDPKTVYPVKSNSTFGNAGGNYDKITLNANGCCVAKFTLTEAGVVSKLTAFAKDNGNADGIKGVIFDDDGISAAPLTILGVTDALDIEPDFAAQWNDLTFGTPVSLPAGDYWLGVISGAVSHGFYYSAQTGGIYDTSTDNNYASVGNWNATAASGVYKFDIYATYTAGGGGDTHLTGVTYMES